jgi:hypothetical protein
MCRFDLLLASFDSAFVPQTQTDLNRLNCLVDEKLVEVGTRLFTERWLNLGEYDIIQWFQNNWDGERWGKWKCGSNSAGIPPHNNGLEGLNNALKENGLARERAMLGVFAGNSVM